MTMNEELINYTQKVSEVKKPTKVEKTFNASTELKELIQLNEETQKALIYAQTAIDFYQLKAQRAYELKDNAKLIQSKNQLKKAIVEIATLLTKNLEVEEPAQ